MADNSGAAAMVSGLAAEVLGAAARALWSSLVRVLPLLPWGFAPRQEWQYQYWYR